MDSPRLRILAFWPPQDYGVFFVPAFLKNPEYEIEIISGDRSSHASPHAVDRTRLRHLRQRLENGEFDLVLSGNIWTSAWLPHKRWATRLAHAARLLTFRRKRLDTWWAPDFARVAARKGIPFITVDLRDNAFIYPWDWPLLRESFLYFKRELFFWPDRALGPLKIFIGSQVEPHAAKLRPLSYGINRQNIPEKIVPWAERTIDVFMSCGSMNPLREKLAKRLEALSGEFRVVVARNFLSDEEYQRTMRESRLVLCTESYGCETWRVYDASSLGSIPLVNWAYTQNAFPLEPGRHAIYYTYDGDDLERQIRAALAQPKLLEEMSAATRAFTQKYKDRAALGRYVIETTLREFALRKSQKKEMSSGPDVLGNKGRL